MEECRHDRVTFVSCNLLFHDQRDQGESSAYYCEGVGNFMATLSGEELGARL